MNDVEKLLERLRETSGICGRQSAELYKSGADEARRQDFVKAHNVVLDAEIAIVQLQSELAAARAGNDAVWNEGRDTCLDLVSEDRFFTDGQCSWSKFMLDKFQDEARALKRPTPTAGDKG